MKTVLTKTEKTIAITAVIAISSFFVIFMQVSRETKSSLKFESVEVIDYTMARPDQVYSEYTLDGRELDRSFEGLPPEKSEIKPETKIDKKKQELINKKVAEVKKKDEINKKLSAKQAATLKAQEQVQTQAKLKYEQTQKLKTDENNNSKRDSAVNSTYYNNAQALQVNNGVKQPNDPNAADVKSNKKSYAQWREIIFKNPTPDSLALFVAALRKNEVSEAEYQAMAQELIAQRDVKFKGLGLMALRSAPSLASLSQLVHLSDGAEPTALGELQSYVDTTINAYLQPQNLRYLNQALATKDKKLVLTSLSLLNDNLTKFGQGDFSGLIDPRNSREGEVVKFSIDNYKLFLPTLSQIVAAQDPDLLALAQQITSLIQSSNRVAT